MLFYSHLSCRNKKKKEKKETHTKIHIISVHKSSKHNSLTNEYPKKVNNTVSIWNKVVNFVVDSVLFF